MKTNIILSRDEFRESVFQRDNFKCVICGDKAKDAHHIIERRLFSDGGYYLDNGASLCEKHHIEAEETTLSCEEIRLKAGIENIIIPIWSGNNCGKVCLATTVIIQIPLSRSIQFCLSVLFVLIDIDST